MVLPKRAVPRSRSVATTNVIEEEDMGTERFDTVVIGTGLTAGYVVKHLVATKRDHAKFRSR